MSGHSKWATTKHQKAVVDAKRSKLFAKLVKNIEVAARTGGGDLAGNPTLVDAVQKAKKSSVPIDNINRAVKRGSGQEAGGADYQSIIYEGYGTGGIAVLLDLVVQTVRLPALAAVPVLVPVLVPGLFVESGADGFTLVLTAAAYLLLLRIDVRVRRSAEVAQEDDRPDSALVSAPRRRPIVSTGISPQRGPISSGWRISRSWPPGMASSTPPSSSMSFHGRSLVGAWRPR